MDNLSNLVKKMLAFSNTLNMDYPGSGEGAVCITVELKRIFLCAEWVVCWAGVGNDNGRGSV